METCKINTNDLVHVRMNTVLLMKGLLWRLPLVGQNESWFSSLTPESTTP